MTKIIALCEKSYFVCQMTNFFAIEKNLRISFYVLYTVCIKDILQIVTFVIGSAKRGLIVDPNSTYLETHNLTCEFGTTV